MHKHQLNAVAPLDLTFFSVFPKFESSGRKEPFSGPCKLDLDVFVLLPSIRCYHCLSLKYKISGIWLVETAYVFLIIFNCYHVNISGMWNTGKLGEIDKTFEFTLTYTNLH